jgi:hypothetical protein
VVSPSVGRVLERRHDARLVGDTVGSRGKCVDELADYASTVPGKRSRGDKDQAMVRRVMLASPRRLNTNEVTDVLGHEAPSLKLPGDGYLAIR